MTDAVEVSQADREAAAALIRDRSWLVSHSQPDWTAHDCEKFVAGDWDSHFLVQAFALHRLSAEEGKAELVEALRYVRESLGNPVPINRRHVARRIDDILAKNGGGK